jgi:hypothetical protein
VTQRCRSKLEDPCFNSEAVARNAAPQCTAAQIACTPNVMITPAMPTTPPSGTALAFPSSIMSLSPPSPGAEPPTLKTINYRGGVVEFRIPSTWKEEYSDTEGGTFYEERPDSPTFRLKMITAKSPSDITRDSAVQLLNSFKQVQGRGECQASGNALARYEESGVDRGHRIKIFYWIVCNPVPPRTVRIATFSYTVLQSQERDARIVQDLELLDREIRAAEFSAEPGVTPTS